MARTPITSDQFEKNAAMIERGRREFQELAASLPPGEQIRYTRDAKDNPGLRALNNAIKKLNLRNVN